MTAHALDAPAETGVTLARVIDACPTGPELALLLDDVSTPECGGGAGFDDDVRLAIASGWQRLGAWVEARLASAVVAVVGETPELLQVAIDGRSLSLPDMARHELGVVLRETPGQVMRRIHDARTLVTELPRVHAALAHGAITPRHARVIRESSDRMALGLRLGDAEVESAHRARVDALCDALLPLAARADDRALARRARSLVMRIDADGAARRSEEARRHSTDVWVRQEKDGLAVLTAIMPGEAAHACKKAIDAVAAANHDDDPEAPIGMLRAAALADLVLGGGFKTAADFAVASTSPNSCSGTADSTSAPIGASAPRVHIDILMELDTFLGLDDAPAELAGAGAIPASVARALIAADASATMRRLLVDPMSRALLDVGRRRYAIDDRLRAFLGLRDRRCRFPGCTRAAEACDLDHATNFDGSNTTVANLGALCRPHHLAKTHGGWRITESDETGACIWVAPSGRTYRHAVEGQFGGARSADAWSCDGSVAAEGVTTPAQSVPVAGSAVAGSTAAGSAAAGHDPSDREVTDAGRREVDARGDDAPDSDAPDRAARPVHEAEPRDDEPCDACLRDDEVQRDLARAREALDCRMSLGPRTAASPRHGQASESDRPRRRAPRRSRLEAHVEHVARIPAF